MKGVNKVDESAANYAKRLRKELQLDISQWCRIKSLHRKGGKAAQPLLEQLCQLRQEMRAVSENPAVGDRALYDLATRRVRLEVELARLLARTQTAIYQTFTPEQQQQLSILHQRATCTSQQVALI